MKKGKYINIRFVKIEDAEFILSLRLDNSLNKYLNKTENNIQNQIDYIKKNQKEIDDYYFIIETKEYLPCGTVRIYDIKPNSFSWGSWIISSDAPFNAAIESALLVYDYGFDELGFDNCHFQVLENNIKVVKFHQRFGAKEISRDGDLINFEISKEKFLESRKRFAKYLKY